LSESLIGKLKTESTIKRYKTALNRTNEKELNVFITRINMAVGIKAEGIWFTGELNRWIRANRFKYATIEVSPNYEVIRIKFYREAVPEAYKIDYSVTYMTRIICASLTRRLLEMGLDIVHYERRDDSLILWTSREIEEPYELVQWKKQKRRIPERPFGTISFGIYFTGDVRKWILKNEFRCVEIYSENTTFPMYFEFHFYKEEDCPPEAYKVTALPKLLVVSCTALAKYLNRYKLVPKYYEIVGNVLRVWLVSD
jgi:hypothetical protein